MAAGREGGGAGPRDVSRWRAGGRESAAIPAAIATTLPAVTGAGGGGGPAAAAADKGGAARSPHPAAPEGVSSGRGAPRDAPPPPPG